MERSERFTWQPGDIVVTGCPTCIELTERMLTASSADEITELERAYSAHANEHDVPEPGPAMFNEFRRFPTEPG